MRDDVDVDDAPPALGQHDEDEQYPEGAIGTVKASIDAIWARCLARKVRHVCEGAVRRRMYLATLLQR